MQTPEAHLAPFLEVDMHTRSGAHKVGAVDENILFSEYGGRKSRIGYSCFGVHYLY